MEFYNNTFTVEADWLLDEGIMTYDNYKALAKRNHINVVRRGCRNTPALVAYDSMPERFKQAVRERVGCDPYQLAKVNQLDIRIEHDHEASMYFENYQLEDGRYSSGETRREYYSNAIVLKAIHVLINDKKAKMSLEIAMQWNAGFSESVYTFANTIHTHEGGTHEEGFRTALTSVVNKFGEEQGFIRKKEDRLTGDDVREGLTAIVSIKISEPQFEGQTKEVLGTPAVAKIVQHLS